MHHPVFSVPDSTGGSRLCESSIYMSEVAPVDEASGLFDRGGWYVVSVHPGSAQITLEVPGGKVRAERTELGTIEGQLKALITLFEHHFTAAPVVEQRGNNEGQHRARQHDGLCRKYAVCKSDARVSEMPYTER
jgi:hypothetical protein